MQVVIVLLTPEALVFSGFPLLCFRAVYKQSDTWTVLPLV